MDFQYGVALYCFIGLLTFLLYFLTKNFKHFEDKGIPYIKPQIFFGNVKDRLLLKKSFHEFLIGIYFHFKNHPYYGLFEGSAPVVHITDPDLIKNVLVKDFDYFMDRPVIRFKPLDPYTHKILLFLVGKEWKQVRSAITPAFSSGRLKAMTDIENKCGEQLIKYISGKLEENGGKSAFLDMKETLGKFTLDVIASTAFGVELDSNSDPNSIMAQQIAKFNDIPKTSRFILLFLIFLQLPRFITKQIPVAFFNTKTINYLTDIIKDVTKTRKEKNIRRNDFLQLLIDAQSAPITEHGSSSGGETKTEKDGLLTEENAIAQAIIFFIAGYETSATTLTMLCYELAKNPDIQEKLRGEVINKLKATDGKITYDMLNEIPYLDMALAETLRMYPPVARLDRICVKKYKLKDVDFNPGDKIAIPIYGLQNDPDYFPEPDKFRPERFLPEEKEQRHPFLYLPFGAGPRNCIGLRAAQVSMKICMVHLMKEYRLEVCDKTKVPFEFHKASMLLKAKDGVILNICKLEG